MRSTLKAQASRVAAVLAGRIAGNLEGWLG